MKCAACAEDNPTTSRFCGACGAPLETACAACGASNSPRSRFCGGCGGPLAGLPASGGARPPRDATALDRDVVSVPFGQSAERRQVTVLFCDLVGSTALSGHLDPEELRELIQRYRATCAAIVERFDGYVAQYLGDGILAYFGYPRAHEDDPERAVRAALDLVDGVPRIGSAAEGGAEGAAEGGAEGDGRRAGGTPLAVRVGIATGLVVTPMGQPSGEDSVVIGETPNVAARLQDLAPPNGVVVAPETRRLLGERFAFEDLGIQELRGVSRPLRLWRVLRPNDTLSRFEAAHGRGLTPLVGRDEEVDLLLRRWAQVKAGQGQAVFLSGEAGIGKSRIAQTLVERVESEGATRLRFQGSPHHANSVLFPVVGQLERLLGLDRCDAPSERLARIEALVTRASQAVETTAPLLAALLSVPAGDRYPAVEAGSQRQRDRTLAALRDLLVGFAATEPVLVLVEDAHWIDPTSRELLDLVVDRLTDVRALLLVTSRPGYWPGWTTSPHVSVRIVNRLRRTEATEMVRLVAGDKALPDAIGEQIVAETDGVPLFIEEVTKMLLESGALAESPARYRVTEAPPGRVVPATLRDSLIARLDQVGAAREVAQIGSVVGRQFSFAHVAALSGAPAAELEGALAELVRAELIQAHGRPPDATYVFKHALVQEAAYDSLLLARRRALHRRMVDVLDAHYPRVVATSPEVLADHCAAAGLRELAARYWYAAGLRASEHSANLEAVAHLTKGLEALDGLPDSPERQAEVLRLLVALGPVLMSAKGPRTPAVAECYGRALRLCAELPESPLHFAALWGSWRIAESFHTKRERAEALLALAVRLDDAGLRLQAHHCLWASLFHSGQHEACVEHADRGLRVYELGDYRSHGALYGGHDPRVCALGEKAFALWLLGFPDRSLAASQEARDWAGQLGHPGSIVHAMDMRLLLHRYRRDVEAVRRETEEMIALSEEHGLPVHRAIGWMFRGWALAELGRPEVGIEHMREGLEVQKAIGTREDFPVLCDMLAGVYAMAGRGEAALGVLDEVLEETERTGLSYWTPELYRTRGEVLLGMSPGAEADAGTWFRRALDLAHDQRARSLELRAARSLARLETRRGRPASAHRLLAPIHAWFREGLATVDLMETRALLDELGLATGAGRGQTA